MNSIQLLLKEIKNIVKNKKILVQLIAILFIPILYGGMFLWAFWDPYDKLDELPVAVVNLDKGATLEGEKLNIGNEFIDNLKDNKKFEWKFVDDAQGIEGLENQDYYMMVRIPEDFSEKATTLLNDSPSKLKLEYIPNESYNFLSSQIGETAVLKIKDEISSNVSKTYAETMFSSLKEMSNGIKDASDGANAINDGTTEAKNGSVKLRDNLETLAKSSITFEQGMMSAYTGSQDLNKGLTTLNDASSQLLNGQQTILNGSKGLQDGSNKLYTGLTNLSSGTSQLNAGAEQLSVGAAGVRDGILKLQGQLNAILPTLSPAQQAAIKANMGQINALVEGSKSVAAGAANLSQKSAELNKGASALTSGMNELNKGQNALGTGVETITGKMQEFDNGVKQVAVGGQSLTGGLSQLEDGAKSIKNGSGLLADGSKDLSEGLNKLSDGTDKMANKLTDASDKTSKIKDVSDKNYDMFASPVKYDVEKVNPVPNYGTGFAPYFLSLGLFVGALILTIIFDIKTPVDEPKNAMAAFLSKFGFILIVGIIQALIADFVLLQGLGLEVKNVQYFVMCSVLTSVTFLTLIQMLVTWFDNVGRFVAIVLLILQLTTSAGTFPLELIPDQLKVFNKFLPMTYTVKSFKASISSGNYSFMWDGVEKLIMFIAAMSLLSILYFAITLRKKKEMLVHENA